MNKLILNIIVLGFIFLSVNAFAAEREVEFLVPSVDWSMQSYKIGSILRKVDGVKDLDTDFGAHTVYVVFDDSKVTVEELKNLMKEKDFPVKSTTIIE